MGKAGPPTSTLGTIQRLASAQNAYMSSAGFWDQRFVAEGKIWGEDPSPTVPQAIELFRAAGAGSVLVLGCGYGRNAKDSRARGLPSLAWINPQKRWP
jgi:hypothetical protein